MGPTEGREEMGKRYQGFFPEAGNIEAFWSYREKTNSLGVQGSLFGGRLHFSGHQRTTEQVTYFWVLNDPLVPWKEPVYLQKVSCLLAVSRILAVILAHPSSPIPARYLRWRWYYPPLTMGRGLMNAFLIPVTGIGLPGREGKWLFQGLIVSEPLIEVELDFCPCCNALVSQRRISVLTLTWSLMEKGW